MTDVNLKMLKDTDGNAFVPFSTTDAVFKDGTNQTVSNLLDEKQATLVSGTNIKTINNESLLGAGNITVSAEDEIAISTTEPTGNEILWINPNEMPSGIGSYISNTYGTSQEIGYSQEYVNENIPTKSNIIETTTSGNIKCYKFPDGTMVASGYASDITIPGNSVYSQYFNLPVAFKDTNFVVIPSIRNTGAFWTWVVLSGKIANSSKIQIDAVDNDSNAAYCSIQFIAIGKWK